MLKDEHKPQVGPEIMVESNCLNVSAIMDTRTPMFTHTHTKKIGVSHN